MASLPQQQPSQRRPSPEQTSPSQPHSPIRARSATSEDSQTLWLHDPPTDVLEQQEKIQQPSSQPTNEDDEKKCWICFSDSTEDTPETSPWRDPCPCALVAHEECLLDWIADTEAPKNSRNRSLGAPKILCPQCKSEIKLARPRNIVVEGVQGIERLGAKVILPGAAFITVNMVHKACMGFGEHAIHRIFGMNDGYRILIPLYQSMVARPIDFDMPAKEIAQRLLLRSIENARHWRLFAGVPLIAPLLILSRTTLADSVLPILPVAFLATQAHVTGDSIDFFSWPPSASMAFSVLPYIRAAYNTYYERVWAAKEKKWLAEIQPRSSQTQAEADLANAAAAPPAQDQGEDGNIFEVRIDGGIFDGWDGGDDQLDDQARQDMLNNAPAPPQQPPQDQDAQAQPPPNIQDNRPAPQPAIQPQQGERRLSFSPVSIAETIIGALMFPTIAELSGEVLRATLPTAWTRLPVLTARSKSIGATGLLQEKWGRSLVGGCLFVVFKDALMLYVRWKMAQMHRSRRVLDVDRSKLKGRRARV